MMTKKLKIVNTDVDIYNEVLPVESADSILTSNKVDGCGKGENSEIDLEDVSADANASEPVVTVADDDLMDIALNCDITTTAGSFDDDNDIYNIALESEPAPTSNKFFDKVASSSKPSNSGWKIFGKHPRADEIALALEYYPETWAVTPLRGKRPFLDDWNKEGCDRERNANAILHGETYISKKTGKPYKGFASGSGLLTGDISGRLIAVDQDGQSAIDLFDSWYAAVNEERPETVAWTSGTAGKRQDLFRVPEDLRHYLKDFTNHKIKLEKEELDFRYNGVQSALPPSYHPTTGAYKWINSPSECEIAELPGWLCEKLLRFIQKEKAEKRIMEPPKMPKVDVAATSGNSTNGLVAWLHEMQGKSDPTQLYNHPKHDWKGSGDKFKGAPCDRDEEWGEVAIFRTNLGTFKLKDFSTETAIDALHYESKINRGLGDAYPSGKNWISCLRSLASRMNWQFPESEHSKKKYQAAITKEQERLNGLDTSKFTKVIEFDSKYIPKEEIEKILPTDTGYILTSDAPMGAGKTTLLKYLYPGCKVTAVVPTIALGKGLGHESGFNLTMREDVGTLDSNSDYDNSLLNHEERLCICYPSLWRISNRKGDVLVLDETVGGFEFLLESGHCNKNGKRSDNIAALVNLIRNHKIVVLTDAFLNNFVINFVSKIRNDLDVYHISKKLTKRKRNVYKISIEWLENKAIEYLEKGCKIAIAADSKDKVRALESKYVALGYKVIAIYREIAGEPCIQRILANPTEELKKLEHNILIYSPTIGSGVSIEIDYDAVFAINSHLPSPNFVQMTSRIRTDKPLYYCVKNEVPIDGCKSFLPSEQEKWLYNNLDGNIANQLANSEANKISKIIGEDSDLSMSLAWNKLFEERDENEIVKIVADLRAFKAWNLTDKDEKIHVLLKKQGYQIITVIPENKVDTVPTLEALGYTVQVENKQSFNPNNDENTKGFRDINRGIDAENVISAELIDEDKFKALEKKTNLSLDEHSKRKRYLLEKNLPGFIEFLDVEAKDTYLELELKDRGNWLRGVRNFVTLKQVESQAIVEKHSITKLIERWEQQNILTLQDASYLKTAAYNFLLKDLKLFSELDFTGEKEYTSLNLTEIVEKFTSTSNKVKQLKQWFSLGKITQKTNLGGADKKWIDKLLDRFAYELVKSRKIHGVRYYRIQKKALSKDFVMKEGFREFVEKIQEIKIAERLAGKEEKFGAGSHDIVNTQLANLHPKNNEKQVMQNTALYGNLKGFDPTDGSCSPEMVREWWGCIDATDQYLVTEELGLGKSNRLAEILGIEARAFLDSVYEAWSKFMLPYNLGLVT